MGTEGSKTGGAGRGGTHACFLVAAAARERREKVAADRTDMVCFAEVCIMINCGCRADYGRAAR